VTPVIFVIPYPLRRIRWSDTDRAAKAYADRALSLARPPAVDSAQGLADQIGELLETHQFLGWFEVSLLGKALVTTALALHESLLWAGVERVDQVGFTGLDVGLQIVQPRLA
jgi:hypothetical protein